MADRERGIIEKSKSIRMIWREEKEKKVTK